MLKVTDNQGRSAIVDGRDWTEAERKGITLMYLGDGYSVTWY